MVRRAPAGERKPIVAVGNPVRSGSWQLNRERRRRLACARSPKRKPARTVTAIEAIVRQDDRRPSNAATGGCRPLLLPDTCWGHDELVAVFTRERSSRRYPIAGGPLEASGARSELRLLGRELRTEATQNERSGGSRDRSTGSQGFLSCC